jgi:hypothetical protein
MSGKWISIGRRPCGPAFAMSVASWAMAMARTMDSPRPWWSQNVILELGFFIGALGRRCLCLEGGGSRGAIGYQGLEYVSIDPAGGWKLRLAREVKAAGFDIDMNQAI